MTDIRRCSVERFGELVRELEGELDCSENPLAVAARLEQGAVAFQRLYMKAIGFVDALEALEQAFRPEVEDGDDD